MKIFLEAKGENHFGIILKNKIGGWLYTEFKKNGITIPAIKLYKGSFIG